MKYPKTGDGPLLVNESLMALEFKGTPFNSISCSECKKMSGKDMTNHRGWEPLQTGGGRRSLGGQTQPSFGRGHAIMIKSLDP